MHRCCSTKSTPRAGNSAPHARLLFVGFLTSGLQPAGLPTARLLIALLLGAMAATGTFATTGSADDQTVTKKSAEQGQDAEQDQDTGQAAAVVNLADAYDWAVYKSTSGQSLPYRILKPDESVLKEAQSAEGTARRFPLVLFLHGAGERGDDNEKQLVHAAADFARSDRRRDEPAFVVFPQCPSEAQWVDTPWTLPAGKGTFTETPSKPLRAALDLVDLLVRTNPIDPDRIYVTGLSMGGYGAWHAAALQRERFAAVLAVCGGSDPDWADRYKGLPIWSFHGDQDTVVPVVRGREIVSALALAGHQPELRYSEYEGVGHNSWSQTYARDDVHAWLFRQHRVRKDGP